MTIDEILRKLSTSDADAFRRVLVEETLALQMGCGWSAPRARDEAAAFFEKEIAEALAEEGDRVPLSPEDVLHYRRRPAVWAVATLLRRIP